MAHRRGQEDGQRCWPTVCRPVPPSNLLCHSDVLYCPETTHSLARALQRLAECWGQQEAPVAYVAFTARNPETCQLFVEELGTSTLPLLGLDTKEEEAFRDSRDRTGRRARLEDSTKVHGKVLEPWASLGLSGQSVGVHK